MEKAADSWGKNKAPVREMIQRRGGSVGNGAVMRRRESIERYSRGGGEIGTELPRTRLVATVGAAASGEARPAERRQSCSRKAKDTLPSVTR